MFTKGDFMFFDKMKQIINSEPSYTENGAMGFKTTGHNLLDLNFFVSSLRNESSDNIISMYKKAFYDDKTLALKWLFFARDARFGLGERRLFRIIISDLSKTHPDLIIKLIDLIPHYGRYDDLFFLLDSHMYKHIINFIKNQLDLDMCNMDLDKPISLLAKWMPSINTSSENTKKLAKKLSKDLGMDCKQYRQTLSRLRKYLNIVEVKMSSNAWDTINYESVPSKANLIYRNAFLIHDEQRREAYLESLSKGESKINASVLQPHEIVHKYYETKKYDESLEQMWLNLPNTLKDKDERVIVVADGSGSMTSCIGNSNTSALEVANALAIYFAEKLEGEFKNKYITFSENPAIVDLSNCANLKEKLEKALHYNEIASTNIEKVFGLISKTAMANKMSQDDLPTSILIISDMEFNSAVSSNTNKKLFDLITRRFNNRGYKVPKLIFWNINSRTKTIPLTQNDLGVVLVSGFSIMIMDMIMSFKLDPYEVLVDKLNSDRYNLIDEALKKG